MHVGEKEVKYGWNLGECVINIWFLFGKAKWRKETEDGIRGVLRRIVRRKFDFDEEWQCVFFYSHEMFTSCFYFGVWNPFCRFSFIFCCVSLTGKVQLFSGELCYHLNMIRWADVGCWEERCLGWKWWYCRWKGLHNLPRNDVNRGVQYSYLIRKSQKYKTLNFLWGEHDDTFIKCGAYFLFSRQFNFKWEKNIFFKMLY